MEGIGHNNPPPTPFDAVEARTNDLYHEAKMWLDGDEVTSEEYAEQITTLLNMLRQTGKQAEEARTEEKAPHLEAGRAVDAKYKPITGMIDKATKACKAAMAPWLKKKADILAAEQEEARAKAAAAQAKAQAVMQAAAQDDLQEREDAERAVDAAKEAEKQSSKLNNTRSTTKGAVGRAVGLRTYYEPELIDGTAAARHYWQTQTGREAINELLMKLARQDVSAGKREIPGFIVHEEKRVA